MKERLRGVPEELRQFADCKVFDKGKMRQMTEAEVRCLVIGGISIDDDESSILKLSPKFAVMSRLDDEEMETDIEVSIAKTRYEISRQEEQQQLEELEESSVKRRKLVGNEEKQEKADKEEIVDAKERQVFDPLRKVFDYSKRRTTDLKENTKIHLPSLGDEKYESEIEMIRTMLLSEYKAFKII